MEATVQPTGLPAAAAPAATEELEMTNNKAAVTTTAVVVADKDKDVEKGEGGGADGKPGKPAPAPAAAVSDLFRFATPYDYLLITVGFVFAAAQGGSLPLMTLIFGNIIQIFTENGFAPLPADEFTSRVNEQIVWFCILGLGAFIASYLFQVTLIMAAERQAKRMREEYYRALLHQDIAWFDKNSAGQVSTRVTSDSHLVQDGIGEKLGLMIMYICTFLGGFILAFAKGWKMALVLLTVIPLMAAAGGFLAKLMAESTAKGQLAYGKSGSVAEEVLSAIRTVAAYSAELFELRRYENSLKLSSKEATKKAHISGTGLGTVFMIMFLSYALAFWYGSTLIASGEMNAGSVLNVFFSIIIGAMSLGNAGPNIAAFTSARGAMLSVLEVIDRKPAIDSNSESGTKLEKVSGDVEFKNVKFTYPNREDTQVLKGFSLSVQKGQTVALVGYSGCGKSTIIQLMERFYDPTDGAVTLDGVNLKELNVKWYRQQIGFVSQEPTLFSGSIYENILFGKQDATKEQVEAAAKLANAHTFIFALPNKYQTTVGEQGLLLSGGQRQRIAIARALVKDPKILLLDEATAALDSTSEKVVQDALDAASKSRTTIVIAHRLSTVQRADKIVVMDAGEIIESGTHMELMQMDGKYAAMVNAQKLNAASGDGENAEDQAVDAYKAVVKASAGDDKVQAASKEGLHAKATEKEEETQRAPVPLSKVPMLRIAQLNSPEWKYMLIGAFGSCVNGLVMPIFSLIYAEMLDSFHRPTEEMLEAARFWALMFIALAAATGLANYLQVAMFEISGIKLTARIRALCFKAIVRQDIAFFDDDKNHGVGMLSTKLAQEADLVKGFMGGLMGSVLQTFSTLIGGLVIAFVYGWELTLIILCIVPVIALAGALQMNSLKGNNASLEAYRTAGQVVTESVQAIRTVASLTAENRFFQKYYALMRVPHATSMRASHLSAITFGVSQSAMFLGYAAAFYAGSRFIANGSYDFLKMNTVLSAVIFTAMGAGQVSTFMPNLSKCSIAALDIFTLIDSDSSIDPLSPKGEKLKDLKGEIVLQDIKFVYPSRPNAVVMENANITIKAGETVALVGESGCGKSTIIALLERFYNPASGQVKLDGVDISTLNLRWLRTQIGLVTQEPKLFSCSIGENIAYGNIVEKDGDQVLDATPEQLVEAAKLANIHDFIEELPDKYNTLIGEKGSQLSGGQRQRIAIARALLRNPRILLLDEATSALDGVSEKLVQEALEKARVGRTTIIIAHRLSTIQNADRILVLVPGSLLGTDGSKVVEEGTHEELLAKRGHYYSFVQKQKISTENNSAE